jgi:2-Cys peroxiredoxin 5
MSIQIGESLPTGIELHNTSPGDKLDLGAFADGKKLVVFAVPGAFTPGCDKTHLPGYLADADAIKAKGVDAIICIAVNDAFVMQAWGASQSTGDKIMMLADADGSYTKALGLEVVSGALGGLRSKRYSMIVDNGTVTALSVEPDGFGLSCSLAKPLVAQL